MPEWCRAQKCGMRKGWCLTRKKRDWSRKKHKRGKHIKTVIKPTASICLGNDASCIIICWGNTSAVITQTVGSERDPNMSLERERLCVWARYEGVFGSTFLFVLLTWCSLNRCSCRLKRFSSRWFCLCVWLQVCVYWPFGEYLRLILFHTSSSSYVGVTFFFIVNVGGL